MDEERPAPTAPSSVDPLVARPPRWSLEEAEELGRRLFGVSGSASSLDSERDQNFKLVTPDGSFLLKVANPADDPAVLEMQTQALLRIRDRDPELPVMEPLPARDGRYIVAAPSSQGEEHLVRLFTYLPGEMRAATELDPDAIARFGELVARTGLALRGFFHPAAGHELMWDLKHTPRLRPLLPSIEDPDSRSSVATVLKRFEEHVENVLPGLRAQPIHNDLTVDNVLHDRSLQVSGIVDFGDLVHTSLVCDLAIALTSLMGDSSDRMETARCAIGGYTSVVPIEPSEAAILGDLIGARLAALVAIASWRVRRFPENAAYLTNNGTLTSGTLEFAEALGWHDFAAEVAAMCLGGASRTPHEKRDLIARREAVLGPALSPLSYDDPIYLVRGYGVKLYDHEGTEYLDAYNNVPVVGHSHPHVVEAVARQSAALNTNTRYLHENVVELGERLVESMPVGLDTVMFYNSGSEANDIAWRLVTTYTGAGGAIVTERAYHGVSTATIALSPEEWTDPQGPAHVATIPAPDGFRGRGEDPGSVERAVEKLHEHELQPAAIYLDALFTSDGIFTPSAAYVQEMVERVRVAGGLFVADEVQCGYGRSGTHLWGFERYGLVPDLVTLGKPMGNGFPVAAVITRRDIAQRFADTIDLFSTFGGNPVAASAALAVLDVIEGEDLVGRVHAVGQMFRERLESLSEEYEPIGDVRGAGLLIGLDIVREKSSREPDAEKARAVMNGMRDRGVLVGITGPHDNVLKIRPPLVFDEDNAGFFCRALEASLGRGRPR